MHFVVYIVLLGFSIGRITTVSDRNLTMRTTKFKWFSTEMETSSGMNNTAQLANDRDHCRGRYVRKSQECVAVWTTQYWKKVG